MGSHRLPAEYLLNSSFLPNHVATCIHLTSNQSQKEIQCKELVIVGAGWAGVKSTGRLSGKAGWNCPAGDSAAGHRQKFFIREASGLFY